MGTGKSCVGQLAANSLHFTFVDTDDLIVARVGKSITRLFEEEGEAVFREWERRIVGELASRRNTVIATGGGLPANDENLASLKTHALVVCLWTSPETIWERVRGQTHRPLLNHPDAPGEIRRLIEIRAPYYRQADVLVNTEMRSVKEVAQQVVHQFLAAQSGGR